MEEASVPKVAPEVFVRGRGGAPTKDINEASQQKNNWE